jgi:hypothetical protein
MMGMRRLLMLTLFAACGGSIDSGMMPGGDDDDTPPASADSHTFCVQETNRYRTDNGRPAVTQSAQLEDYADEGAQVDHASSPHNHFSSTSGGGIAFAENECPHWDLSFGGGDEKMLIAECIAAFFSEGPGGGHYENMMNAQYSTLGCGIFKSGTDYTIIQDFGGL